MHRKNGLLTNDAWGSINGFTSEKKVVFVPTTFTHPALADNSDGSYQVRIAGTDTEVTLSKQAKGSSSIILNEEISPVNLIYNEDMSVDYDALREAIFQSMVKETSPQLSVSDVTIEYYAEAESGSVGDIGKAWMPLEGGKNTLTYPAISAGTQQIRISFNGDREYSASQIEGRGSHSGSSATGNHAE